MKTAKPTVHQVVQIIVDKLGVDQNRLTFKASFSDDLGADSLDIYELLMTIEKEFKIKIQDDDIEKILTVGALIDYIDDRLALATKEQKEEIFTVNKITENTSNKIFLPTP
jgi:acyl carrier protein